ncbi:energy transducer TonB [Rhodobacter sp. Har01]|uniref:energy transducer TonB family protein n=1 Tax=Rhodobacter sp. Har01 TaxID=2883999 RepID=UPI001D074B3E|nr:energy transducer TonB [Rhodobacter sp. Har01]MCB6177205.1 energy transducer TonB [Rhodobacter sp. Har01]
MAQRGKAAPGARSLRALSAGAVFAPAGAAPALVAHPAPAATAPTTGPFAAPWAALVSASLHAGAALALVAVPAAMGAGSAGDSGLDSATRPQPPSVQVTLLTPADLLPAAAPAVATAPPGPLTPPAAEDATPALAATAEVPDPRPSIALPQPPRADAAPALPPAPLAAPPPEPVPEPKAKPKPKPKPAAKPAPKAPRPAAAPEALAAARAAGTGQGAVSGAAGSAGDPGLTKGKIADLKAAWGAKIRSRVESRKFAVGAAGTVKVRLTVARTGRLLAVSVVASSGVAALDRAAVKAVKAAGNFPAAPKGLAEDSYSFTLPIRFQG